MQQRQIQPKKDNSTVSSSASSSSSSSSSSPSPSPSPSDKKVKSVIEVKQESFTQSSIYKELINLSILLALFFIFSSPQIDGLLSSVSYLKALPFNEYINLLIRGLLFVIIFFIINKFIL